MRLALRGYSLHVAAQACVLHARGVHPLLNPYLDPANCRKYFRNIASYAHWVLYTYCFPLQLDGLIMPIGKAWHLELQVHSQRGLPAPAYAACTQGVCKGPASRGM